ncbi:molybdenum cofactor biosynthesis protein C [Lachnoanaerobaculum saburreum F0468]|jgi:molybdenum cofactor biosynthesis protein C|uniref:cyclic pyranopterin monophosphate synthase n=2 Tax=Lachnoanaerobaculum saburreum TaxID=467210 RepID=I0R3Q9_9FIRM|nr:cyclic pyranopterin monophosphate synthase MoaC [Lachnoanaerobaculum saburreum]EFU77182.1 molybdenum cofactor biosynthesis protein C [Lachnoanaerobaculum saburreum DSM 3986]EIC94317.1 molybdenum cofactor biosynthesis protein C [Lachnoanaerobaculum saburreum F0468]RKW56706.1 MAG: cyclic pyranopterin monophosphate synthase MoaC [Lachnospiraceae bacterium]
MEFTHFDENKNAVMVDVSEKDITNRIATATGRITLCNEAMEAVKGRKIKKGDVLTVAQVAGIMGQKRTSELIPMCHNINLTSSKITFEIKGNDIIVFSKAKTSGQTGVEMEALMGVNIALLTIYDMCKAIDKRMLISDVHLVEKTGGKSGDFFF